MEIKAFLCIDHFLVVKVFKFFQDEHNAMLLWINTIPIVLCGIHSMGSLSVWLDDHSLINFAVQKNLIVTNTQVKHHIYKDQWQILVNNLRLFHSFSYQNLHKYKRKLGSIILLSVLIFKEWWTLYLTLYRFLYLICHFLGNTSLLGIQIHTDSYK